MISSDKITIYTAAASNRSLINHLKGVWLDLPQAHELGLRLFKRNLMAQYRQSLLGIGWALIPPLVTAALWIILRQNGVMSVGQTSISYPVFVISGTLLWQLFSESILSPLKSVNENRAMLSKINIPREGLLLSGLYELLFNTIIKLVLLALVIIAFKQQIGFPGIFLVPAGIVAIVIAGFSIGLLLTPIGMLFSDISRGLTIMLPFLMYLTPVIYPTPKEGMMAMIMKFNPIATLLPITRDWLTNQPVTGIPLFIGFLIGFVVLFFFSLIVYRLAMPMIIERIGS